VSFRADGQRRAREVFSGGSPLEDALNVVAKKNAVTEEIYMPLWLLAGHGGNWEACVPEIPPRFRDIAEQNQLTILCLYAETLTLAARIVTPSTEMH